MFKKKQKAKDNYARNFMILSLAAFLLFFIFFLIVVPILFKQPQLRSNIEKNFYLNNDYQDADPMLTQVPKLTDIINGPIISAEEPILGDETAPITITIYTNFSCKYCGDTLNDIKKISNEFSGKVKIMHKDYPSSNKSFASYQAAIAGRCAQNQGKFWEMSDKLYENYNNLNKEKFLEIAEELKLNTTYFNNCLDGEIDNPAVNIIDANILEADALGIVGIPSIYVDNIEMPAEVTYEELKTAVERELK